MRCFIAVDFPNEVKKEIKKIQDRLPDFIGKKTEIDNLHLTLKFLGEIDENKLEEVKKRLNEIKLKSFETKIDSIGVFSPSFIKIIWLHLINCNELQKQIDDKLSYLFKKEKRFMSHLTISRVKKVKSKNEFLKNLNKIKINNEKFNVNNFKLQKSTITSEGPKYETIEEYGLE